MTCKKKNNLPDAAAEITHTAAERSAELRDAVIEAVQPLIDQAQETLAPFVQQAQDTLEPIAKDTKKKSAAFAATALDKAQPGINDALDKVTPSVDAARVHVQENLIPKLSEVLHTVGELPTIAAAAGTAGTAAALEVSKKDLKKANKAAKKQSKKDAKEFGKQSKKAQKQAVAQLRDLAPAKSHKGRNTFFAVVLAAGVVAGVVYLLKKFLGEDSEAGWAAHEPSEAYVSQVDVAATEGMTGTPAPGPSADAVAEQEESDLDAAEAATSGSVSEAGQQGGADEAAVADQTTVDHNGARPDVADAKNDGDNPYGDQEPRPFTDAAAAEGAGSEKYGADAYVGENPPEGYTIKGNERSMKYHVEGSGGFDRTIADVWFNSEQAAEAAGFTKAQR